LVSEPSSAMAGVGTSSEKFDVMKFDGTGNFGLWQRRVKDLLVHVRLEDGGGLGSEPTHQLVQSGNQ
jgi:hypothetical protein